MSPVVIFGMCLSAHANVMLDHPTLGAVLGYGNTASNLSNNGELFEAFLGLEYAVCPAPYSRAAPPPGVAVGFPHLNPPPLSTDCCTLPPQEPPVGALRFKPAVMATTLHHTDHQDYCDDCTQGGTADPTDPGESEDCLCVNVWRPSGSTATSKLPVYVFIHGGGFIIGSGAVKWTAGEVVPPS
jgi:hypothetical protein